MRYSPFFLVLPTIIFGTQYITANIFGQLGNQMFQIAAAYAYAIDHGAVVSFPDLNTAINGELNCKYIFNRINKDPFPENTQFYFHDHFKVVDNFYYAPITDYGTLNVRLHAHFPSEKYFKQHEHAIQNLFAPTEEIRSLILAQYGDLIEGNTVAIHIRTFRPDGHADPLHIPRNLLLYRWYYYTEAMSKFSNETHFLIFSDDIDWTERHFPKNGHKVTFIRGNPHYIDFYMISLCKHQIVSYDSTFSWWAAWLNQNPTKIVIIPDRAGGCKNSDMLPDSWIKISRYPPHVNAE